MTILQNFNWVTPVWMQSGVDALREAFDATAALKTKMVSALLESGLWNKDRLTWNAAVARFNSNLNPSKSEFFKFSEIVFLSIAFDRHQPFLWWADKLGYEVRRKPRAERQAEATERLAQAHEDFNRIVSECANDLRLLGWEPPTTPVHPALRENSAGAFCLAGDHNDHEGGF